MPSLWPDVGDHDGHAVAAYRVLENVRELGLSELNEWLLGVRQADDSLFQKGKGLVNVLGLLLSDTLRLLMQVGTIGQLPNETWLKQT